MRSKKIILRLAIPTPLNRLFDYRVPENINSESINLGSRVLVSFNHQEKIGIIVEIASESELAFDKLKPIEKCLDTNALLQPKDIELLNWVSRYYHYPIGSVFCNTLPTLLKKGQLARLETEYVYQLSEKKQNSKLTPSQQNFIDQFEQQKSPVFQPELALWSKSWRVTLKALIKKELIEAIELQIDNTSNTLKESPLKLNPEQKTAVEKITLSFGEFKVFLLEGVTGSGKTEVYMQLIAKILEQGLQVLVLLPEITLTPQLEARFQRRFISAISIYHSKLNDKQRLQSWLAMQTGTHQILLGTRSALFTPIKNLGLIVVDEEHDSSFKQQEGLRFAARDVAVMRAKLHNVPIVLGSATPALESLFNVEKKRYHYLHLSQRAGNAKPPRLVISDIRNKRLRAGLSAQLLKGMEQTLAKKEQVLLFLNRRGFAPTLICHDCGWVAKCNRCDANLVIYEDKKLLRCHHCGEQHLLVRVCPSCQKSSLKPLGLGTQRVEEQLNSLFRDKTILRLDTDSTRKKGQLEKYLQQINQGEVDIILGTQMLAKGHHFPNVTLVALLDIDSGLFSTDFRAEEKLAQLITQVSGRAGRENKLGTVILQTRQPEHPLLINLIHHGYASYAKQALSEREMALLPPYSYQALLRVQAFDEQAPENFFSALNEFIQQQQSAEIFVLGPVSAPMAKRDGRYHYQLLFQSQKRSVLHQTLRALNFEIEQLKEAKKVRWSLDIDPIDLY